MDRVLEAVVGWCLHAVDHGLPGSVTAVVAEQNGLTK